VDLSVDVSRALDPGLNISYPFSTLTKGHDLMKKCVSAVLFLFACSTVLFAADLKTYQGTYAKQMDDIAVEHGSAISKLHESYAQSLNNMSERVINTGDLDRARAVMSEIERFTKERTVTSESAKDSSPDLKRIQLYFRQHAQSLESAKARQVLSLVSKYDSALGKLQTSLTQQKMLDDALEVQNERKAVADGEMVVSAKATLTKKTVASPKVVTPIAKKAKTPWMPTHQRSQTYAKDISASVNLSLPDNVVNVGEILDLKAPARISSNRNYSMVAIPKKLKGMKYIQIPHKVNAPYTATVKSSGRLWLLVHQQRDIDEYVEKGWLKTDWEVVIGSRQGKFMVLFMETDKDDLIEIPGRSWFSPILVSVAMTKD
jgi:hypothetical protein